MGSSESSVWAGDKQKDNNTKGAKTEDIHKNKDVTQKDEEIIEEITKQTSDEEKKPDDSQSRKFILDDETQANITRLDHDREMLVGIWDKGKLSHASIFLCYFSKISSSTKPILAARLFCIELFVKSDTNENVLSIKGPIYNTRHYNCKQFYIIHTNMNELIKIAKNTMDQHGDYNYWLNNCRHFGTAFLTNVKEKCTALTVGVSCDKVNKYIHQYSTVQNKDIAENATVAATAAGNAVATVATVAGVGGFTGLLLKGVLGNIAVSTAVGTAVEIAVGQPAATKVETLSFIQVLKEFPI